MKMKHYTIAACLAVLPLGTTALLAQETKEQHAKGEHAEGGHDDHDHAAHADKAGPNGGKVLMAVDPHLEFFVTEDRKVKITALTDDLKPAKIGATTVKVMGGDRSNPTRMTFTEKDGSLISDKPFPAGNDFPVVVQIKLTPDAKTVIEKFNLNLSDCPTCDYKEYACTCAHGEEEDGHEGHDHSKHEKK